MSDTAPAFTLPPRPHLPYYRKQAKALLRALKSGDAEAASRVSRALPRLSGAGPAEVQAAGLTLSDAQWVLAREHGFESWPKFKQHIDLLTNSLPSRYRPFEKELSYYEERAGGLLSVLRSGLRTAYGLVREWHPNYAAATDDDLRNARITLDDARLILAREHGFEDWNSFAIHIEQLSRGEVEEPFLDAFDAMKSGDTTRLRPVLDRHPELTTAYGTNGNTLLNLATAFFDHGDHSRAPSPDAAKQDPAMQVVRLLLERGADPDQANDRGWTALHAAAYGNNLPLIRVLLEAGASIDLSGHGDGGTPLVQALFWGHRRAAELLADEEITPRNLRVAAGLGDLSLLRELFREDGTLKPEAGLHGEFYRPHSGFPVWRPIDDPRQILDEALVYAARNGRTEAVAFLVEHGADIHGEAYIGTALHWAASVGETDTVRWLIEHGADPRRLARVGGECRLTPLHAAAWSGQTESARLLLDAGADPSLADHAYFSPPWGWAGHFGHTETREVILAAASRSELFAAVTVGSLELTASILDRDPDAARRKSPYWGTPLSQAAAAGRADLVKLLLAHGADPNARDRSTGQTPMDRAAGDERDRVIAALEAAGGKRTEENRA